MRNQATARSHRNNTAGTTAYSSAECGECCKCCERCNRGMVRCVCGVSDACAETRDRLLTQVLEVSSTARAPLPWPTFPGLGFNERNSFSGPRTEESGLESWFAVWVWRPRSTDAPATVVTVRCPQTASVGASWGHASVGASWGQKPLTAPSYASSAMLTMLSRHSNLFINKSFMHTMLPPHTTHVIATVLENSLRLLRFTSLHFTSPHSLTHSLTHSLIHAFTYSLIHSFTHSFTHSLVHSFTRSLIHSFTHSFFHSIIHSIIHSLTPSLIHAIIQSFTHSPTHSLNHSLIRSIILSFIHSFIPSYIHSLTHSLIYST